jgi:hypothetical protein
MTPRLCVCCVQHSGKSQSAGTPSSLQHEHLGFPSHPSSNSLNTTLSSSLHPSEGGQALSPMPSQEGPLSTSLGHDKYYSEADLARVMRQNDFILHK